MSAGPRRTCDSTELRALPLFHDLPEGQLEWLCRVGTCRTLEAGPVYTQGEQADSLFVLLAGEVLRTRRHEDGDVAVDRSSQPGTYGGAVHAYVDAAPATVYADSMRATLTCRFFILPAQRFASLLNQISPLAVHLLSDQFLESRQRLEASAQRDHLLALGSLAAGLTHELSSPAAAGARATSLLRSRVWRGQETLGALAAGDYSGDQLATLLRLQEDAMGRAAQPQRLTPLEAADGHAELVRWLEAYDVDEGWDLAPSFVHAGIGTDFLDEALSQVGGDLIDPAVRSMNHAVETELLMQELERSTRRISALINGAQQYARVDRAPFQLVDVHALLAATLLTFEDRLAAVDVVKIYDPALPPAPARAAELSQVWTQLIDNALGAMRGVGVLTISTSKGEDHLRVEVADTGGGVPERLKTRIFEPFFTTKPLGEGAGLGLDVVARIVVNRHHGHVRVHSTPGDTRFVVELPLRSPAWT